MSRLSTPCQTLTRSLKRGEEDAWTRFHSAYYEFVLGMARSFTRNHHAAEELTQQTFLRLVRHMKPFEEYQDFENWIRCLTRCAYIDSVRKSACQMSLLEKFTHLNEMRKPDPVAIALQTNRIDHLLSTLTHSDRDLVSAFYLDQQSQTDIAKTLGVTARAVESRLGRIRKTLRLL